MCIRDRCSIRGGAYCLKSRRAVHVCHCRQGVDARAVGIQHERAFVVTTEPSLCIVFKTDWSDWAELFTFLDLVQTNSRAVIERRREDRPIAESSRADLVPAVYPTKDQAATQHVCHIVVACVIDV